MNSNVELVELCDPFFENSSPSKAGDSAKTGKVAAALKNHCQAEKRRRERINGHLSTLRTLIPGSTKMDKASLLAKAISHLKELETNTTKVTKGLIIPLDIDEVSVEEVVDVRNGEAFVHIKASVCCDYRHELLYDLKQSLNALHLKLVRVEMGTLSGRMKIVFFMSSFADENKYGSGSVQRALRSVLDGFSASQEFSSTDLFSSKRQRVSFVSCPSTYSSYGELQEIFHLLAL